MIVGIPKEIAEGECRVAGTPDSVRKLIKLGYEVHSETNCGELAHLPDELYEKAGAKIIPEARDLFTAADILLKVLPPTNSEIDWLRSGTILLGFIWPAQNDLLLKRLAEERVSVLSMDCVPRITRAQKLDALSSMANIAGYRAVIEAANHFGSFFTGQITAAGKVPPAKVLVIGATGWERSYEPSMFVQQSKIKSKVWAPSSWSWNLKSPVKAPVAMPKR